MLKKEARGLALANRKNEDIIKASNIVVEAIIKSKLLDDKSNIGIYYPLGKEIDITTLLDYYPNKNFYLPITKDEIYFVNYNKNTKLINGPFNTKEPVGDKVDREKIDVFIIPCVAISNLNQRIGYGKGYYDRYLSGYSGLKLGICYKNSAGLDVECDDFDVVLDYIFLG